VATRGLSKDFGGGRGVFDLDLEVRCGEILGFLGPNGAGKSTTMRMLLDLIRPTAGTATILGFDSRADSLEIRRRVGYLPGDLSLEPRLTGSAILAYLGALRGGVPPQAIDVLADRLGADLHCPVRELSTGNRRKLGLIQAFMHDPELLILDEPIAGLDPLVQDRFHGLLHEAVARGRTVMLSSHTLSEVERVADRVAILRGGRLVTVDAVEHLRSVAVQRLEIEFAGAGPDPEVLRALPGVREVSGDGGRLVVAFEGSADRVVKAIAAYEVRSLHTREDDLEDIFLRFYRDAEAA
jgi:ABC-2 type transport system ATP-binding protein